MMNPEWLLPQWPAPARVRAVCTTRAGGKSVAPYDSLNLGEHVGDRPPAVAANRAILARALGARPVFLSQPHGVHVASLSDKTPHGTQADGCVTDQTGVACCVMVADCLPVLLTHQDGGVVAAAHAGWRGLAGQGVSGILESVVASVCGLRGVDGARQASGIVAWLGPCIGPRAFEVGDEVREAFLAQGPEAKAMFLRQSSGKWLADLPGLARLRLWALGVEQIHGNDGGDSWCTFSNPLHFFSHRRDRISGRMAACIWLD